MAEQDHDSRSQSSPTEGGAGARGDVILEARELTISFYSKRVVSNVSLKVFGRNATAIIGPSGCGKSTLLRHFNRLNELLAGVETEGGVFFRGADLYGLEVDPVEVRRQIGMVFQKPTPFPESIYENIAWGPRACRSAPEEELPALVERSLKRANLWKEVYDRLDEDGLSLSGGQQQRLCIARAIAMTPDVILMDEPTSALDPEATAAIEELIVELKRGFSIVVASHDMGQAARVADFIAVMKEGRLVDYGATAEVLQRLDNQPGRSDAAC